MDSTAHIAAVDAAVAQLPESERGQVRIRTDAGGCSKALLTDHDGWRITCFATNHPRGRQTKRRG